MLAHVSKYFSNFFWQEDTTEQAWHKNWIISIQIGHEKYKNIKKLFEIIWKSIIFTSLKDGFTYSVILVYTVYYNKSYIFINMLISILFLYL